ncbi:YggT family protein [Clostridium fallax]|nr:YggT family protein [Clostridium fallax]
MIIVQLCNVLEMSILLEVILSLFLRGKESKVLNFLKALTSPIVMPFKKLQDKFFKGLTVDFSPFFALVLISFIRRLAVCLIV